MELSVSEVILAVVISAVAIGLIEFGSWDIGYNFRFTFKRKEGK
jgi:hypothetical protein